MNDCISKRITRHYLSICIAILACNCTFGQRLVTTYYDWNKIHPNEIYYVNGAGQKTGAYKLYDKGGVVIKEYNYLNGQENGLCIDYAVNGDNKRVVAAKGSFIGGQPNGAFLQYCDEDGYKSKSLEGAYKMKKKIGLWKEWWCTKIYDKQYVNVLKSIGAYKEGNYDGLWSYYNPTGTLDKRGTYMDGKEEGTWTFYDSSDSTKILYKGDYKSGQKTGPWRVFVNSKLEETDDQAQFAGYKIVNFNDNMGQYNPVEIIYLLSGEKGVELHMMIGKNQFGNPQIQKGGPYTVYYKDGTIAESGNYFGDKKIGNTKFYSENGTLSREENYNKEGIKDGKWNIYFESGKLKSTKTYHGDYSSPSIVEYDENGNITKTSNYGN
jgi:antitoxin component YwqK of YwqJK toxin-antitoxin module